MRRPIREPGRLTQAAYARHRKCGPAEVHRALKSGLIHLEKDGSIDPTRADREWAAGTNPASASKPGGMKPVPAAAVKAAKDVLRGAGETVAGGAMTFVQARTANEIVKAQLGQLRLQEREGQLIDKALALDVAFNFARQFRDGLQVWPSRVAAVMAAEIGVEPHALEIVLDKHVSAFLQALGETDVDRLVDALARGRKGSVQ